MATGKTKVVNQKGYAFITLDAPHESGKRDVFAHFSSFESAGLPHPEVGDRYSFDIQESDRGINAVNLQALD